MGSFLQMKAVFEILQTVIEMKGGRAQFQFVMDTDDDPGHFLFRTHHWGLRRKLF